MGEQEVSRAEEAEERRLFTKKLLPDLRALEIMLAEGAIESGRRRMGAEQELFLVDSRWQPAPVALEVLADLARPSLHDRARPLQPGAQPRPAGDGGRLPSRRMEAEISRAARRWPAQAARRHGAEVVLTGILPTLEKSDLTLENMTPRPRYLALNEAISRLRGGEYQFRIKGRDELLARPRQHDARGVQHQLPGALPGRARGVRPPLQRRPGDRRAGARRAPSTRRCSSAAGSGARPASPSSSSRSTPAGPPPPRSASRRRGSASGRGWVRESVLEIFQEDIARFPVLLAGEVDEDPLAELAAGRVPRLQALRLHNGTVYRWNRPCYGISDGRPHLRIENRVLPAGPSVVDEVANAAFWLGLLRGAADQYGDITRLHGLRRRQRELHLRRPPRARRAPDLAGLGQVAAPELVLDGAAAARPPGARHPGLRLRRRRALPRPRRGARCAGGGRAPSGCSTRSPASRGRGRGTSGWPP